MQTFVVWTAMNWLFQEWTQVKMCVASGNQRGKEIFFLCHNAKVGVKQRNRMAGDSVQWNEILLYTVLGSLMEWITQMWF